MSSHAHEAVPADASSGTSSEQPPSRALPTDRADPDGPADRRRACAYACADLGAAYGGDTYRLLTDLANLLQASVAYVDRPTVEAHLERPLTDTEWSTIVCRFSAMAFDEHVGDAGTIRTDWIESVLLRADVPGRARTVSPRSTQPWHPLRR